MKSTIIGHLRKIEADYNATILFACESGSRAWGTQSTDSDYDVRFIYVRNEPDWYISLCEGRDTIERVDGIFDMSGWDIRKALRLAKKSNPALIEWRGANIVYIKDHRIERLFEILATFSAKAMMHHCVSLAAKQKNRYWREGAPVDLKAYIYVMRSLMAAEYMANNDYAPAPVIISSLYDATELPGDVAREFLDLVTNITKASNSQGRYHAIDQYISMQIPEMREAANLAPNNHPDAGRIESLYLDIMRNK